MLLRSLSMTDKLVKGLLVSIGLFVSVLMLGITGDVEFVADGGSGGQTRALGKRLRRVRHSCNMYVNKLLTIFHLHSELPPSHYTLTGKDHLPFRDTGLVRPRSRKAGPRHPPRRLHPQNPYWQVLVLVSGWRDREMKNQAAGVDGVHYRPVRETGRF